MIQPHNSHATLFSHNIDAWRIILIVMVVANHTFGISVGDHLTAVNPPGFMELLITTITRTAVPVLSVFSGYLFARYGEGQYFSTLRKKTKSLVTPFLMWNVLPFMLFLGFNQATMMWPDLLIQNNSRYWLVNNLTGFHNAPINGPLYFLRDLFITTAAFLLVRKWLANPWIYGVMMTFLVINYFIDLDGRFIIRNIIPLFFLIGMGLRWMPAAMAMLAGHNLTIAILALASVIIMSATGLAVENNSVGYVLGSLIAAMAVISLAQTIRMPSPMQEWGRDYSFTIFLSHWWILLPLNWMWNQTTLNHWWFVFGAIPVIVVAGIGINRLIQLLPQPLGSLFLGSRIRKAN